jgi:ketosteroid isomerase-like protein
MYIQVIRLILGVLFSVVLPPAILYAQSKPTGNDEQELRSLVRAWDEATVKGDTAILDRLLADEFAFVGGPNKAQYLASINRRTTDSVIESAVSEKVEVQVYGDAAVVVGLDVVKGKTRGQPFEHKFRYMDVWIKRSGRWQCVKVYSTLIEKK